MTEVRSSVRSFVRVRTSLGNPQCRRAHFSAPSPFGGGRSSCARRLAATIPAHGRATHWVIHWMERRRGEGVAKLSAVSTGNLRPFLVVQLRPINRVVYPGPLSP